MNCIRTWRWWCWWKTVFCESISIDPDECTTLCTATLLSPRASFSDCSIGNNGIVGYCTKAPCSSRIIRINCCCTLWSIVTVAWSLNCACCVCNLQNFKIKYRFFDSITYTTIIEWKYTSWTTCCTNWIIDEKKKSLIAF